MPVVAMSGVKTVIDADIVGNVGVTVTAVVGVAAIVGILEHKSPIFLCVGDYGKLP